MKRAAGLAGLVLMFATGAASSPQPDATRLALAHRLVAALEPFTTQSRAGEAIDEVSLAWEQTRLRETMPSLPASEVQIPITQLDVPQLFASLKVGSAEVAPRFGDADAANLAGAYDARTLKAVADFYGSPAEQAMQERRRQSLESSATRGVEMAQLSARGPISGEAAAQEMTKIVQDMRDLGPLVETPAETAFAKSAAARAFQSGHDFPPPPASLWPDMIAAAEADYCARKACDEATHRFFAALSAADFARIYDPSKAAGIDTMAFPGGSAAVPSGKRPAH